MENHNSAEFGRLMKTDENNHDNSEEHDKSRVDFKVNVYLGRNSFRRKRSPDKTFRTDARRLWIRLGIITVLIIIVGIVAFLGIYLTYQSKSAEVLTKSGLLRGQLVKSPQGTQVMEFLGVPFAKPPVGELRYADPEPVENWGELDATDWKYSCIQPLDTTFGDFVGTNMWNAPNPLSEDCLYMHIWVPFPKQQKRAVMVWIYGGGFYGGSNSLWVYDGKALAAHGDVIVITFNYRVGSLGYLSTGDGRIKGNFGMKDQVMALQWIHDNIAFFGGDPDQVTLFGESSGASSAGLHMMSSYTDKLFKRAIFESGSADSHWSFMTPAQAKERSRKFLKAANCNQEDTKALLKCLRGLSNQTILNTEWVDGRFMVFPWAPTIDGNYLTDTPYNLLKNGKFQKKESLLGVNRDEGTFWILFVLPGFSKDHESLQTFDMYKNGVDTIVFDLDVDTREQIKTLYASANRTNQAANRDALDKVCGDRAFTCPTKELTEFYNEAGLNTYFYYLTYRASNEVFPPWMGVIHGAEIQWVFGMPLNDSRGYTEEEKYLSKQIMSYWANFAKNGNPNGKGLPVWPRYTNHEPKYLEMKGPSDYVTITSLRDKYCIKWKEINRKINEHH